MLVDILRRYLVDPERLSLLYVRGLYERLSY